MVRATRSGVKVEPAHDLAPPTTPSTPSASQAESEASDATLQQLSEMSDSMDISNGLAHHAQASNSNSQAFAALHSLGDTSRQLIQAIQRLEALRIDATIPSLPKFVVVGDQSHGKSSIIEALSSITLPRATGTCTRCPFRITTTASADSEEWKCDITLLFRYSYNPRTRSRWDDGGEQRAIKFCTVNTKSELENELRLAQIAILNPDTPHELIRSGRAQPSDGVPFSPNIIALSISEPGLPELSLFDLPGAINVSARDDEQHLVGFIESLIKTYLRDEKALVLLASAGNQDLDCSTALKYIRECNAQDRAMGVLTKPDLITDAQFPLVRKVLTGERFTLGGGWFVTKQLSQEDIESGLSHETARRLEAEFFQGAPWCTALTAFSDRFGIPSLHHAISQKLSQHIRNDLPQIADRVQCKLSQVDDQLNSFPPESKEPCMTVMSKIDNFNSHFVEQLKGEALKNDFRTNWREIFKTLSRALEVAKPTVILSSPEQISICLDSDEEMDEDSGEESPAPPPSKKSKGANGHATPRRPSSSNKNTPRSKKTPVKKEKLNPCAVAKKVRFTLDEIRQAYEDGRASTLPGPNWKVTMDLTIKTMVSWSDIVEASIKAIEALICDTLQQSMDASLGDRKSTKLYDEAANVISAFFKAIMDEQRSMVTAYVQAERHKPVTYQLKLLQDKTQSAKRALESDRAETRAMEYMDRNGTQITTTKLEERRKRIADLQTKLGPDEYSNEIDAIAQVLAYYDLASANIPDVVATMLEFGLLHKLQTRLKTTLQQGLKAFNADYCLQLLAEDPGREAKRRELLSDKEKLIKALEELHGLHGVA